MKGIGAIVIIGLLIWWLSQRKEAQAAPLLPGETYPAEESEYEKLHKIVPITRHVTKEIPVFENVEQYMEAING